MNSLERFKAFVAREPVDRPLRYARFTPDLLERVKAEIGSDDPEAHFDMDLPVNVPPKPPADYVAADYSGHYADLPPDTGIDDIGVARRRGTFYHFTEIISPLRHATSLSELEQYPVEDCAGWDRAHMAAEVEEIHKSGRFAELVIGHMYENSWQIRGYEEFLVDMMTRPEWCAVLLEKSAIRARNLGVAAAEAGVDLIRFGDDVANQNALMFRQDLWRDLIKSRWARVCAAIRDVNPNVALWYHSDGNIECIIDELMEVGVQILNPLQPECMDLERIAQKYRGRLLFDGAMGTQSVFPFGTADDVRACVKERVAVFGQDLMLSPTHVLEPEVPIENIKAFFEACDSVRFGA